MSCSLPMRNLSRQAFRDHSTAVARRLSVLRARIPGMERDPQPHRFNEFGQPLGAALPGWRSPPFPPHVELAGRYCRLVPLDAARHARDLYEAQRADQAGERWTYLFHGPYREFAPYETWCIEA